MRVTLSRLTPVALAATLAIAACGEAPEAKHVIAEPATVEKVQSGPARITLAARAAERLGVTTVPIEDRDGRKVVVSGAVIVDARGGRWVYVNEAPLVYLRHAVRIDREEAGMSWLAEGPPAGTRVVTFGAAELLGAETGIGK